MMPRYTLTLLLASFVVASALGETLTTQHFGEHEFTLVLPDGYALRAEVSPKPWLKVFGFTTEARGDGTRGLIQVSLLDLAQTHPGGTAELAEFATKMAGGVRGRRRLWKAEESEGQLHGTKIKRIEWTGSPEPSAKHPANRAPVAMRGVMIIGIRKQLGFALHTQDLEPFAEETVPLGERALTTFELRER
jgi:hypothetical protein